MLKLIRKIIKRFDDDKKMIFIYPALSGILLSFSHNYPLVWFFSFFSLIPLIHFSYKTRKSKDSFIGFLIFGFIFSGNVMIWLWKINLFAWTGISNFWATQLIFLGYWLFFISIVGIFNFLLFGWLFSKFKTKTYLDIFYFSFLWVFLEYFRTLVFALVTLAPDSFFGAHSTFGFLGYVLASNANLLQLAQFGGVYLLSFIVIFVNLFIYWTFSKGKKGQLKLKLLILIVFIIFINLPPNIFIKEDNSKEREIKVSVLQTKNEAFSSITQQKEERKRKIYENLLLEIGKKVPDSEIIIFPEDTRFTQKLINNWRLENYYKYIFGDDEKMIIDSSRMRDKNNQTKLRLYYYNIEKDQMDEYDKLLLTPGGEYVPSIFMFLSRLAGFGGWAKELNEGKYTRGKSLEIGYFKNKGIGGVFCFEITSPEISRKMTQEGAQLFVNPVSHSSFKGYPILYHQTLNMIKVRAVENNRYFIQAGNYIPSSIITNKGRVISNKKTGPSVFNERVFFKDGQTLYVRFGNWLVGLAAVVIIIFIGRFFYIKFKWFV